MKDKVTITRDLLRKLGACEAAVESLDRPMTLSVNPEANIAQAIRLTDRPVYFGSGFASAKWLVDATSDPDVHYKWGSELYPDTDEYGLMANDPYVVAQLLAMAADNLTRPRKRRGA